MRFRGDDLSRARGNLVNFSDFHANFDNFSGHFNFASDLKSTISQV